MLYTLTMGHGGSHIAVTFLTSKIYSLAKGWGKVGHYNNIQVFEGCKL